MRLLPIRPDHVRLRLAGEQSASQRFRHRRRHVRQYLSLRHLSSHPRCHQAGSGLHQRLTKRGMTMLIDRINEIARARAGGFSRRAFIKASAAAGGGLLLSVGLPAVQRRGRRGDGCLRPRCLHPHRRRRQSDHGHAPGRDGAGHLHLHPHAHRRGAGGGARHGAARACTAQRQALCQSPDRLPGDGGLDLRARLLGAAAPRRRHGPQHADLGRRRHMGRGGERLPGREGRGHPCRQRPEAGVRRASGEGRGPAGAREGRAQGSQGFHPDRHPGQAPRHARQGQRYARCSASIRGCRA